MNAIHIQDECGDECQNKAGDSCDKRVICQNSQQIEMKTRFAAGIPRTQLSPQVTEFALLSVIFHLKSFGNLGVDSGGKLPAGCIVLVSDFNLLCKLGKNWLDAGGLSCQRFTFFYLPKLRPLG
jgi:hypothetical protein